ncbi:hypothetical protein GGI35DRAFT_485310 [Trichoderma velutinum]
MSTQKRVESLSVGKSGCLQTLNYSAEEFREYQLSASGRQAPHEPYFPNVFEIPSGKVDPSDSTLKYALAREVKEETGLDITEIFAELSPMVYTTEKKIKNEAGDRSFVSKSAIQLNFVVSVSDGMVKLSADEHSESRWATVEELDELDITKEMKSIIREAFQWTAGR